MENGLVNSNSVDMTPHLTQEEVIALVREDLHARTFNYDITQGFWAVFQGNHKIRGGEIRPTWSVAFETPARQVIIRGKIVEVFPKDYYGVVDDETGKLLYFIHSTGYLEPIQAE